MKNRIIKRSRALGIFAGVILAIIAITCVIFAPLAGTGVVMAAGLLVGGIELNDRETAFITAVKEDIQREVSKYEKGYVSETKLNEILNAKWAEWEKHLPDDTALKTLTEAVEAQGMKLAQMQKEQERPVSYVEQIISQLKGKTFEQVKKEGLAITLDIHRKTVGTVSASGNYVPFPVLDTGPWGEIPLTPGVIRPLSATGSNTTGSWAYVDKGTREGTPGATSQGSAKNQVDFTPVINKVNAVKYTAYMDFTEEAFDDLPNFAAELLRELSAQITVAEETGFLAELDGSPAFDLTTIDAGADPDTAAACLAAATQVRSNNFEPNAILLNHIDYANMLLSVDENGAYKIPPFLEGSQLGIAGVRIYPNNKIAVGYLLCGDFSKYHILDFKGVTIRFGYSGDNFKANIQTAVAESRVIHAIKTSEADAFVYDAIADIVAAITVGS